jgi:uncharacterized peroxidase-related enzyme
MPFFKSLPADAGVRHILQMNKPVGRALIDLHESLMRSDSPLTPGQHEMIAAFVSGLNECQYCLGVHRETAEAFGLPKGLLEKMVVDLEGSGVDAKMLPLLQYVRLLTQSPHQLVQPDADKVLAAGWSERALHDAILTACLFNFMNRLLEGHGVKGTRDVFISRGIALKQSGYAPLLSFLK